MRTRAIKTAVAVALCGAAGCYRYVPVERAALAPGSEVRIEMTRVGFAALPRIPGQPGPTLAGRLVSTQGEAVLLRVAVPIRQSGQVLGGVAQDVTIPFADVLAWERRTFHPVRTGVAVAGVLGAAIGTYLAFGSGEPPVGEEPTDPPDEEVPGLARIELFSVPVSWFGR